MFCCYRPIERSCIDWWLELEHTTWSVCTLNEVYYVLWCTNITPVNYMNDVSYKHTVANVIHCSRLSIVAFSNYDPAKCQKRLCYLYFSILGTILDKYQTWIWHLGYIKCVRFFPHLIDLVIWRTSSHFRGASLFIYKKQVWVKEKM